MSQEHNNRADTARPTARAVLVLAHCAGMIDLVALPVWMGALVQHYGFDLALAGLVITAFLLGAVVASLVAAPRFHRWPQRACAIAGYAVAALSFGLASQTSDWHSLIGLHALAGLAVGTALSMVHGCIGRSANPHRLFALAGAGLGLCAVVFYGAVPPAIAAAGGQVLFLVLAGLMAVTALACLAFPSGPPARPSDGRPASVQRPAPLSRAAWCAIAGVTLMALNQSITFSMLERIGVMRGFGQDKVNSVLLVCGLVNLLPAVLAALLQGRLSPTRLALAAPLLQAGLAVVIASAPIFAPYAAAASVYAFVMIFAHTFLFGLIAALDPSGRAVAATPAMMMTGAALGPALAGSITLSAGYTGLASLNVLVGIAAMLAFHQVRRTARPLAA